MDKIVSTYNELSNRVRGATNGCHGYNVLDGSSGAETEDKVSSMYHCGVCDRNDGFDVIMITRNGSL